MTERPLAALPMYDWPEVRPSVDALWDALRDRLQQIGIDAPDDLDRSGDVYGIWQAPSLLLAQTCGYPLVTRLKEKVAVVATPHYGVPGCAGPLYSSAVIVRRNDTLDHVSCSKGRRAAINGPDSQSGMAAFRHCLAPIANGHGHFSDIIETGSHRASVAAVASGEADIAAIDAVAWNFAQRFDADRTQALRVLSWTKKTPGLPFITAASRSIEEREALRTAIRDVLTSPETEDIRAPLAITGVSAMDVDDYKGLATDDAEDRAVGYPALA